MASQAQCLHCAVDTVAAAAKVGATIDVDRDFVAELLEL